MLCYAMQWLCLRHDDDDDDDHNDNDWQYIKPPSHTKPCKSMTYLLDDLVTSRKVTKPKYVKISPGVEDCIRPVQIILSLRRGRGMYYRVYEEPDHVWC